MGRWPPLHLPGGCRVPGHKRGAGQETWLLVYEFAPIWDPEGFKVRALAARLLHCPATLVGTWSADPAKVFMGICGVTSGLWLVSVCVPPF